MSNKIIIGIDPDVSASGMARRKGNSIIAETLPFFALMEFIKEESYLYPNDQVEVRIEAGWLNAKANFHARTGQSKAAGEKIALAVGANHETGRKIAEMCDYLGVTYKLVKPLRKMWKGKDGKITHEELARLWADCPTRTAQDMRDAVLLVL